MRFNVRRFKLSSQRRARTVYQNRADVIEQLLRSILARLEPEELRVLVDEVRVDDAVEELLILEDVQQEGNVRLHTAHAEFAERPVHLRAGRLKIACVRNYLKKRENK